MRLIIDLRALNIELARKQKNITDLRSEGLSSATLSRAIRGVPITTRTVGKLANALDVPVESIIESEVNE